MSTSSNQKVSIITLNWSRFNDLTSPWLEDIMLHTPGEKEVIIVDQGSIPADVAALTEAKTRYPDLRVLLLPENVGFPEGCNIGARYSTGGAILFLNNDIRISGDWLTPILQALEMGPKVLAGPSLISEKTGWNCFRVRDQEVHIPYLEGWCLAGKRQILEDIGYFDPEFGTGSVEDVYYCWQAKRAGYILVDTGPLPMKHLRGSTVTDGRLDHYATNKKNLELMKAKVAKDLERDLVNA